MITPVTGTGEVNVDALRTFTTCLVDEGVHGLFPVGSIGEFSSLTREQRSQVIETVAEAADDRPVLAGCGGTALESVRQHLSDAARNGADAGVVVTPYYLDTSQEGLCRFYELLADESPLPLYLYNIPKLTGLRLSIESIQRLAEHPQIVGVKDSTGDFTYVAQLLDSVPDSFVVLQGNPMLAISSLDHGADGVIAGPANVFPRPAADFYETYRDGDRKRAQHILETAIAPVICAIQSIPSPAAFKYLLGKSGFDVGDPLPPLSPLTADQRGRLDACFTRVAEANATPSFN